MDDKHPLEEVIIIDGKWVKVHGNLAVQWQHMRDDEGERELFLESLRKMINERT